MTRSETSGRRRCLWRCRPPPCASAPSPPPNAEPAASAARTSSGDRPRTWSPPLRPLPPARCRGTPAAGRRASGRAAPPRLGHPGGHRAVRVLLRLSVPGAGLDVGQLPALRPGLVSRRVSAVTSWRSASPPRAVRRRWRGVRPGNVAPGRTAMPSRAGVCGRARPRLARGGGRGRSSPRRGGRGAGERRGDGGGQRARSACARWAPLEPLGPGGDGLDGGERERVDRPRRTMGAEPRGQGRGASR